MRAAWQSPALQAGLRTAQTRTDVLALASNGQYLLAMRRWADRYKPPSSISSGASSLSFFRRHRTYSETFAEYRRDGGPYGSRPNSVAVRYRMIPRRASTAPGGFLPELLHNAVGAFFDDFIFYAQPLKVGCWQDGARKTPAAFDRG